MLVRNMSCRAYGPSATEGACKVLVERRTHQFGLRWVENGIAIVLGLRALMPTHDPWQQS